ncbi:MAG: AraC family transcriptional regulator [Comamonadaceae bacterium]|nr:MAG: AraC family transcriptional regulator [Comamonadaceae bacterium]
MSALVPPHTAPHSALETALPTPVSAPAATCSVRAYTGGHEAHAHDHVQVVCALAGRMEVEVDGRTLWVDRASGIVVPAGVRHGFFAPPGARFCVIDLPQGPGQGTERVRRFAVPAQAHGWFGALAQAGLDAAAGVPTDALWPSGVAHAWAAPAQGLAQQLAGLLQAPRVLQRRSLAPERLEQALRCALHEDWPTARMAALYALSAARFHARWQALTGRTPQAWLRGLRLDAAERALARGLPLEATALQVGYANASALAYALRRERGTGARALRRSA